MRISDQEFNRLKILKVIQRAEPIARTQLARLTGLAGGTITEVTGDLVRRGVLLDEKATEIGRGRPLRYLRINPDAARVVGAFLFHDGTLSVEIVNMCGDLLFERRTRLERATSVEGLVTDIAEEIATAIDDSQIPRADISRVGLALPALIDSVRGVIHWLQTFPIAPTPAAALIERRLGLPVAIGDNCNVSARAEHWFAEDDGLDTFSLFTNDIGVAAARYVDGVLWTGANGLNREIRHVKAVFEDGRPCGCGARGCLGSYVTSVAIVDQICEAREIERPALSEIDAALETFAAEARAGDRIALDVFVRAGRILGTAVANHINENDPGRVIVLSFNATLREMLVASFFAAVEQNVLPTLWERTPVTFTMAREDWFRKGAAALALEQLYLRAGAAGPDPA
jgi:predicted NBD/HSP70 family sugar kinase